MGLTTEAQRVLLEILDSHAKECHRMDSDTEVSDEHFVQARNEVANGHLSCNGAHYIRVIVMSKIHSVHHVLFYTLGILSDYKLVDYGD